ncbi:MAG: bifunctional riboflavin kinase/FAD synthetase [Xanthomonadales bacterium]|nr:bifunctional riboflavin kinase/FAD synthetase [Xanthomonadales bacterium]
MRLFRDINLNNVCPRGSVATIGNFDGLHLGHQTLIKRVRADALDRGQQPVVVSFEPLAREYFARGSSPPRIYSVTERLALLHEMGIDTVWLMRFNARLAALSADEFVETLVKGIRPSKIVVGADFRFGKGRSGDRETLAEAGRQRGFTVDFVDKLTQGSDAVSSTRIRGYLQDGELAKAERLLGRPFAMCGRVVRGRQLGRELGYPTANIDVNRRQTPVHGVYAVQVSGAGLTDWPAVASVGTRPTVGGTDMLLEVHLFDFQGDLYGRRLQAVFVKKLRDEEKFDSLEVMTEQMHRDARQARELLAA